MSSSLTQCRLLSLCLLPGCLFAQAVFEQIAHQLSTRYTPHVEGASLLDVDSLAGQEAEAWWATPEVIRAARGEDALPLSGLHLALDPGHIGGIWAAWEGRHFRVSEADFWVREGELVLEVAQRVRTRLVALGRLASCASPTSRSTRSAPPTIGRLRPPKSKRRQPVRSLLNSTTPSLSATGR
jgi:hypothetical protein